MRWTPSGLILLGALCAGCVQTQWYAEGRGEEEGRTDKKICQGEAFEGSFIRRNAAYEACMRRRGWSRTPEDAELIAAMGSGFCGRWIESTSEARDERLRQLAINGVKCERACTAADELKLQLCLIDDLKLKSEAITEKCLNGDDFAAGFLIGTLAVLSENRCFRPLRRRRLD